MNYGPNKACSIGGFAASACSLYGRPFMIYVLETGIFSTVILIRPIFQALTLQLLADAK
jgi:hypothetical protein